MPLPPIETHFAVISSPIFAAKGRGLDGECFGENIPCVPCEEDRRAS